MQYEHARMSLRLETFGVLLFSPVWWYGMVRLGCVTMVGDNTRIDSYIYMCVSAADGN